MLLVQKKSAIFLFLFLFMSCQVSDHWITAEPLLYVLSDSDRSGVVLVDSGFLRFRGNELTNPTSLTRPRNWRCWMRSTLLKPASPGCLEVVWRRWHGCFFFFNACWIYLFSVSDVAPSCWPHTLWPTLIHTTHFCACFQKHKCIFTEE